MIIGLAALYCSGSPDIRVHLGYHLQQGYRIHAVLHNGTDQQQDLLINIAKEHKDFSWRAEKTRGPINLADQVDFSNDSIARLISGGCEYLSTIDDDEILMSVPRHELAHASGHCFFETEMDGPGSAFESMVWRDNMPTYDYNKIWFTPRIYRACGSVTAGNHWLKDQPEGAVLCPDIIAHYCYRAGKIMFAHRQDVIYKPLKAEEILSKGLIKDTYVRDKLHELTVSKF